MIVVFLACFFYNISYFVVRSILTLLIDNISINQQQGLFLCSVFNLIYGVMQPVNGFLIEKYGFRILTFFTISAITFLCFFQGTHSVTLQYILIALLGSSISFGSISSTFFCKTFFNGSPTSIGLFRINLIIFSTIIIKIFNYLMNNNINFDNCIIILQVMLMISGCLFLFSKTFSQSKSKEIVSKNKPIDFFFCIICVVGILSSLPYFLFTSDFIKTFIIDSSNRLYLISLINLGISLGNFSVILSQYFDFRKVILTLLFSQIISIFNFTYNIFPISISCFFIGASYGVHLLPIPYIVKTYKSPIFFAGLFNALVMFCSSFGLLTLFLQLLVFFGKNLLGCFQIINILSIISVVNFILVLFIYYFQKNE